jgi:predicted RNase H-like HicB family nuclease
MNDRLRYSFRVVPDGEGWSIWFPDLRGCTSYAATLEQIGPMALEAMELWLEGEIEDGHSIPEPTDDGLTTGMMWHEDKDFESPNYFSTGQVAAQLGISRRLVNARATEKCIGRFLGNQRVFQLDEVEKLRGGPVGRPKRIEAA